MQTTQLLALMAVKPKLIHSILFFKKRVLVQYHYEISQYNTQVIWLESKIETGFEGLLPDDKISSFRIFLKKEKASQALKLTKREDFSDAIGLVLKGKRLFKWSFKTDAWKAAKKRVQFKPHHTFTVDAEEFLQTLVQLQPFLASEIVSPYSLMHYCLREVKRKTHRHSLKGLNVIATNGRSLAIRRTADYKKKVKGETVKDYTCLLPSQIMHYSKLLDADAAEKMTVTTDAAEEGLFCVTRGRVAIFGTKATSRYPGTDTVYSKDESFVEFTVSSPTGGDLKAIVQAIKKNNVRREEDGEELNDLNSVAFLMKGADDVTAYDAVDESEIPLMFDLEITKGRWPFSFCVGIEFLVPILKHRITKWEVYSPPVLKEVKGKERKKFSYRSFGGKRIRTTVNAMVASSKDFSFVLMPVVTK